MSAVVSPIAQRQVSRFRGYLAFLADLCADESRVERFRESDGTDELCACGRFVAQYGACFGCQSRIAS